MARDLLHKIVPEGVNHKEALSVIIGYFGGGRSTANFDVEVPISGPHALRIRSKHDRLVKINAGPGLKSEDIEKLKLAIHEKLIESQEPFVAANVFFSTSPVKGSFRCCEPELQFLSAPDSAPCPPQIVGEHPFVVEFPCIRSPDVMITAGRLKANVKQWSHILNVVLAETITRLSHTGRRSWVLTSEDTPNNVMYAQHFYSIPGFRTRREDFSPALDSIKEIPHDDYYSSQIAFYGDELAIPDSLGRTLSRIQKLPNVTKQRFLRAAHWQFIANAVWHESVSVAFISTVIALESLISSKPSKKCQSCGRDTGPGLTQLFRTFLDTYVSSTGNMRKLANVLYTIRSNLAHGENILQSDTEAHIQFNTDSLREFETRQDLHQAARIAIINWLYDQDLT